MKIYILRHGIAEESNPMGDPSRILTPAGRKKVVQTMEFLKNRIKPGLILTSPYVRAIQTAEAAAEVLGLTGSMEKSDALLPAADSDDAIIELRARKEDEIFLVGHNPHLSYLVSDMISGGHANVSLKKSSVTCIVFEQPPELGRGILGWMVTPGLLGL